MLSDRLCEHQLLIRHLAALQTRCTDTVSALQAQVAALDADNRAQRERLWAQQVRLVLQTTLLSWVGEAAGTQAQPLAMTPQHAARLVHRVICRTGCLSQGSAWREGHHCRRTGQPCDAGEAGAETRAGSGITGKTPAEHADSSP
ncbi:hypothetical protein [Amphibiibacter pelophylacis]|uniref:Uncharacterized protein n=1 Tax=Amphibiibacter pelophylacis TaxID=1799477 RepID=A0ACC6P4J8_9BURK